MTDPTTDPIPCRCDTCGKVSPLHPEGPESTVAEGETPDDIAPRGWYYGPVHCAATGKVSEHVTFCSLACVAAYSLTLNLNGKLGISPSLRLVLGTLDARHFERLRSLLRRALGLLRDQHKNMIEVATFLSRADQEYDSPGDSTPPIARAELEPPRVTLQQGAHEKGSGT